MCEVVLPERPCEYGFLPFVMFFFLVRYLVLQGILFLEMTDMFLYRSRVNYYCHDYQSRASKCRHKENSRLEEDPKL